MSKNGKGSARKRSWPNLKCVTHVTTFRAWKRTANKSVGGADTVTMMSHDSVTSACPSSLMTTIMIILIVGGGEAEASSVAQREDTQN